MAIALTVSLHAASGVPRDNRAHLRLPVPRRGQRGELRARQLRVPVRLHASRGLHREDVRGVIM